MALHCHGTPVQYRRVGKNTQKGLKMRWTSSQYVLKEFLKCSLFVTLKVLGIGALINEQFMEHFREQFMIAKCLKCARKVPKMFLNCSSIVSRIDFLLYPPASLSS
jgi:hypothetical protein